MKKQEKKPVNFNLKQHLQRLLNNNKNSSIKFNKN